MVLCFLSRGHWKSIAGEKGCSCSWAVAQWVSNVYMEDHLMELCPVPHPHSWNAWPQWFCSFGLRITFLWSSIQWLLPWKIPTCTGTNNLLPALAFYPFSMSHAAQGSSEGPCSHLLIAYPPLHSGGLLLACLLSFCRLVPAWANRWTLLSHGMQAGMALIFVIMPMQTTLVEIIFPALDWYLR